MEKKGRPLVWGVGGGPGRHPPLWPAETREDRGGTKAMLQNKLMRRAGLAASSVVVLGLTLSGCAQQGNFAAASTAADDICRPQRLALDDSQQFFAGDIVKGALIGAAGAALTGYLLRGDRRSAAPG